MAKVIVHMNYRVLCFGMSGHGQVWRRAPLLYAYATCGGPSSETAGRRIPDAIWNLKENSLVPQAADLLSFQMLGHSMTE